MKAALGQVGPKFSFSVFLIFHDNLPKFLADKKGVQEERNFGKAISEGITGRQSVHEFHPAPPNGGALAAHFGPCSSV